MLSNVSNLNFLLRRFFCCEMSFIKSIFRFIICLRHQWSVGLSFLLCLCHPAVLRGVHSQARHPCCCQHMWRKYCILLDAKFCAQIFHNWASFGRVISHYAADEVQSERGKTSVREQCIQYLDRAEKLKEYLEEMGKGPPKKPMKESQSDDKGWDIAYCLAGLYLHVFIVRLGLLYCYFLVVSTLQGFLALSKKECDSGFQQLIKNHKYDITVRSVNDN